MVQPCSTPISEFCVCHLQSVFFVCFTGPIFWLREYKSGKTCYFSKIASPVSVIPAHFSWSVFFFGLPPRCCVYPNFSPNFSSRILAPLLHKGLCRWRKKNDSARFANLPPQKREVLPPKHCRNRWHKRPTNRKKIGTRMSGATP